MKEKRGPSSSAIKVGIHNHKKKKPMKKRNKKRSSFLKKVVSYLRTDSYMYAPLLSSRPSRKEISLTAARVELPLYGENNKKKKKNLIEKVADFLTSDCYMYAPLLSPQQTDSSKQTGKAEIAQNAVSTATHPVGESAEETRPPTPPTKEKQVKIIREEKQLNSFSPARTFLRKRVACSETVKHMVHLKYRSSSVLGGRAKKASCGFKLKDE